MTRRHPRILLPRPRPAFLTLAVLTLLVAPAEAVLAVDPAEPEQFQVSTTSGPPGTVIDVTGSCGAGGRASLEYKGTGGPYRVSVDLESDADGRAAGQLRVPSAAPGGEYAIDIYCTSYDLFIGSSHYPFTVTEAEPPARRSVVDITINDFTGFHDGSKVGVSGQCMLFGTEPAGALFELTYTANESFEVVERKVVEPSGDGRFAGFVTMPEGSSQRPASYRVDVSCYLDGATFGGRSRSVEEDQEKPPSPAPPNSSRDPVLTGDMPRTLPNTGASGPRTLGPVAFAMVASGVCLVLASRRRLNR